MSAGIPVATFELVWQEQSGTFVESILQHTNVNIANIAKAIAEFRAEHTQFILDNSDPREH